MSHTAQHIAFSVFFSIKCPFNDVLTLIYVTNKYMIILYSAVALN